MLKAQGTSERTTNEDQGTVLSTLRRFSLPHLSEAALIVRCIYVVGQATSNRVFSLCLG